MYGIPGSFLKSENTNREGLIRRRRRKKKIDALPAAGLLDGREGGLQSQLRQVVFFADVAQNKPCGAMAEETCGNFRGLEIGKMAKRPFNPLFQRKGLMAHPQHSGVIVGFQKHQIRPFDMVHHLFGNMSCIG